MNPNTSTQTPAFVLSIEPMKGCTRLHPFHLGTIESVAKQIAEEIFKAQKARTVALMKDHRIHDVFDGKWRSDCEDDCWDLDELNGF